MRGRAETVKNAAVWADTTRPYPVGQEGRSKQSWVRFRVADNLSQYTSSPQVRMATSAESPVSRFQ